MPHSLKHSDTCKWSDRVFCNRSPWKLKLKFIHVWSLP